MSNLKQIYVNAVNSRARLEQMAKDVGRCVKVYIHWSAGKDSEFPEDYHIEVHRDGTINCHYQDLSTLLSHTYHRNSGAVAVSFDGCFGATTNDLGAYAPTEAAIDSIAQTIAVLAKGLGIPIDINHVMSHSEAGDNLDHVYASEPYGVLNGAERWDWAICRNGDKHWTGGDQLRALANEYLQGDKLKWIWN